MYCDTRKVDRCPGWGFDENNRLSQDTCAQKSRELENISMMEYKVFDPRSSVARSTRDCFVDNHRNLRYKDGYGHVDACNIDVDSMLRNNARMTSMRQRDQLLTRWYTGLPNFDRGGLNPDVDSRMKMAGEDTSTDAPCPRTLSEVEFDRLTPMLDCVKDAVQDPNNIIFPTPRGGEITRNQVREPKYLESCGFRFNGQVWQNANNQLC